MRRPRCPTRVELYQMFLGDETLSRTRARQTSGVAGWNEGSLHDATRAALGAERLTLDVDSHEIYTFGPFEGFYVTSATC